MSSNINKLNTDKQILKKHVSAIHAVADLTALQRKIVNALLYNAYDNLLIERDHKINTRILCEMIGFDSKNIAYLKEALVGIVETVMQFDIMEDDGERSWEAMSLLTYVKVKGGVDVVARTHHLLISRQSTSLKVCPNAPQIQRRSPRQNPQAKTSRDELA